MFLLCLAATRTEHGEMHLKGQATHDTDWSAIYFLTDVLNLLNIICV